MDAQPQSASSAMSHLQVTKTMTPSRHVQTSPLCWLPAEVLLIISDHSSRMDIACLALCCKELSFRLGTRSLENFKQRHTEEREELLLRLSRDAPRYMYCYTCSILHIWHWMGGPGPFRDSGKDLSSLICIDTDYFFMTLPFHYLLKRFHVQLVMRRHQHGPEFGIPLSRFSFLEVLDQRTDNIWGAKCIRILSVDPRVCSHEDGTGPSLCLRIQHRIHSEEIATNVERLLEEVCTVLICCHFRQDECAAIMEDPTDEVLRGRTYPSKSFCFECLLCRVNFQIEVGTISNQRIQEPLALTITIWVDLGQGVNREDPIWKAPIAYNSEPKHRLSITPGTVRQMFERESSWLSQEDLTRRNSLILQDENYKTFMKQLLKYHWCTSDGLNPTDW